MVQVVEAQAGLAVAQDGSLYYYDYDNFQTREQRGSTFVTTNAGTARAYGFEGQAAFADIVGPETQIILPRDAEGRSLPPSAFVADAHAAGLKVHVWSVNPENLDLPLDLRCGDPGKASFDHQLGDVETEACRLFAAGIDGAFSDAPDMLVKVRSEGLEAWAAGSTSPRSCPLAKAG